MNQTAALQYLSTLERRLRPTPPPWNWDADVRNEWVELVTHYDEAVASVAFKSLERHYGAQSKWPNWVQLRQALNDARRRNLEPDTITETDDCPPSIGIAIAWDAYCEQCAENGTTPNEKRFNKWMRQTG